MAGEWTSGHTNAAYDQEKFLASQLIMRSSLKLVAASLCEKVPQKKGTGLTAYFTRYARMNLPTATLTEGTAPSNSDFSLEQISVTLDQWGDVISVTDLVQLTQSHPVIQQVIELLTDNAVRVMDREVQNVWLAGTNVQYGDGSVTARSSLTTSLKLDNATLHKAYVTMTNNGTGPRDGPAAQDAKAMAAQGSYAGGRNYVAVCGPEVIRDIMVASTSFGSWTSAAVYSNQKAMYNQEVGTWLGFRFVETNFIPRFTIFGNSTTAVASAAAFGTGTPTVTVTTSGGTLGNATFYYKVVRKDLTRGFSEAISIEHTTATGSTSSLFTFAMPATAGYVYDVYFGSSTGDSNLKLHSANNAASSSVVVTAVPSSTTTAPPNAPTSGTPTVHPVYIFAKDACRWVGLQNLQILMSKPGPSISDPLDQRRTIGYKFMGKAVILDQTRILRIEVTSAY